MVLRLMRLYVYSICLLDALLRTLTYYKYRHILILFYGYLYIALIVVDAWVPSKTYIDRNLVFDHILNKISVLRLS